MREAVKRARWLALTLVACVGAQSYPTPSAPSGTVDDTVVLSTDGSLLSALPSASPLVVPGSTDGPSKRDRRVAAAPAFVDLGALVPGHGSPAHSSHVTPPRRALLLGLRAHPANAPPLL